MIGLEYMDATVQGIFFLVAVVVFVIAAVIARPAFWACLVAVGLACVSFVWAWNAFASAG